MLPLVSNGWLINISQLILSLEWKSNDDIFFKKDYSVMLLTEFLDVNISGSFDYDIR